jgi:hypothetical protein
MASPPIRSSHTPAADFILLMLCKYQLGAYAREAREAAEGQDPVELFTPYNFYKSPRCISSKPKKKKKKERKTGELCILQTLNVRTIKVIHKN